MSTINKVKLKSLFADDKESVNPSAFPNETFTLFSIPSYDTGEPETVIGSDVGSSKVLLKDQDILLSRIVPHIRRCWIVNGTQKYRKIGSGEWIVFRPSKEVHPKYLRYFFLTETFGKKFLQTVRGVGGSLLRADPKQVGEFEIPVPSLPTQKEIVAILDKADSLRKKDKQLCEFYNQLARSAFYDMFGDGASINGLPLVSLVECCKREDDIRCGPFGTQLQVHEFKKNGSPLWGIKHVNKHFSIPTVEFLSNEKAQELKQYNIVPGDLVMTRKGTIGNCAIYPKGFQEGIMHSDLLRLRFDDSKARPIYIASQFRYNRNLVAQLQRISTGAIMAGINVGKLKGLKIQLPQMEQQQKFEVLMNKLEESKEKVQDNSIRSESLFQSLLQKAFKGELVKEH